MLTLFEKDLIQIDSLMMDPDYGMGDVQGPTPEIYTPSDGSERLMQQTMGIIDQIAS